MLKMAILGAVDAATPNRGRLKVVCGFLIWGLSLVAGGWLIATSWHDASTRHQVEASHWSSAALAQVCGMRDRFRVVPVTQSQDASSLSRRLEWRLASR